eukprot:5993142-Pyramimonas_sp.AAC.1
MNTASWEYHLHGFNVTGHSSGSAQEWGLHYHTAYRICVEIRLTIPFERQEYSKCRYTRRCDIAGEGHRQQNGVSGRNHKSRQVMVRACYYMGLIST